MINFIKRFNLNLLFFIGVLVLGCKTPKLNTASMNIVKIQSGTISGIVLDSVNELVAFKGIPYAQPPVGELRWRPTKKIDNWKGIKPCEEFGASCPQIDNNNLIDNMSEDCLCLNVWTTQVNKSKKLPVMVWIHGGGLNMGTTSRSYYNGRYFAENGVVLVSVNYRLGQLGFLSHPKLSEESEHGVSGNYGYLDQIEALKWIKNNIASFGGDPNNITLFGESAGGTAVSVLSASPLAKGLFHKAIIQSPWLFGFTSNTAKPNVLRLKDALANLPSAEKMGADWASKYVDNNDKNQLNKLRALDALKLTKQEAYYETRSTIDDWLLPDYPEAVFNKGLQADIPMIIGTNREEGFYYWKYLKQKTKEDFIESLTDFYGADAKSVVEMYVELTNSLDELKVAIARYITDAWFVEPSKHLLNGMAKMKSDVYQYQFTVPNRMYPQLGAIHASELTYVFNTLADDASEKDKAIAKTMIKYWTSFAKTGNPNQQGLPFWKSYSDRNKNYLEIGKTIVSKENSECKNCDTIRVLKVNRYKQ
jgi:para-nitrobenzyl esterase